MSDIHVRIADWQKDHAALRSIRETVFIAEQAVPPELEWLANITNEKTRRAYKIDVSEFSRFLGLQKPGNRNRQHPDFSASFLPEISRCPIQTFLMVLLVKQTE